MWEMLGLGKTNKEIGAALYISEKTVRNYVSNIFKRLMYQIEQKLQPIGLGIGI